MPLARSADGGKTKTSFDKLLSWERPGVRLFFGKRVATSKWKGQTLLSSDIPDPSVRKKAGDHELPETEGL